VHAHDFSRCLVFMPFLPPQMAGMLDCPCAFIAGMHRKHLDLGALDQGGEVHSAHRGHSTGDRGRPRGRDRRGNVQCSGVLDGDGDALITLPEHVIVVDLDHNRVCAGKEELLDALPACTSLELLQKLDSCADVREPDNPALSDQAFKGNQRRRPQHSRHSSSESPGTPTSSKASRSRSRGRSMRMSSPSPNGRLKRAMKGVRNSVKKVFKRRYIALFLF
jgi:hypothetical protein